MLHRFQSLATMSWVMVLMWSILGQQAEELLGGDDGARKRVGEAQQVFVAGNEMVGLANDGKLEKRDVERITAGRRPGWLGGNTHSGAVRQVVGEQFLLLFGREFEFGVPQSTHQFCRGGRGDERVAATLLPSLAQWGEPALREHQCGEHNVRIHHHPHHPAHSGHLCVFRGGWRAQATASATSCSWRSSSASLARTASARWIRTGVRMIWPSLASTSKYSVGPTALVTALGRVS